MEVTIIDESPLSIQERVFLASPGFREWIEQTSLFNTITHLAGTGAEITINEETYMKMRVGGIDVKTALDLPIEVINDFFLHWPGKEALEQQLINEMKLR